MKDARRGGGATVPLHAATGETRGEEGARGNGRFGASRAEAPRGRAPQGREGSACESDRAPSPKPASPRSGPGHLLSRRPIRAERPPEAAWHGAARVPHAGADRERGGEAGGLGSA